MRRIESEDDIAAGALALAEADARFGAATARCGLPPLRRRPPGFEGLFRILVGQQVSTASAAAIWRRLEESALIAPPAIAEAGLDGMRAGGLSRPKAAYAIGLAEAALSGALDFDAIAALDETAARAALERHKGVGRWTADAYLLICEGRPDVFPAGDLALQEGARRLFALEARPSAAALEELAAAWSPWRAVAARVIWAYYAAERAQGDGAPV